MTLDVDRRQALAYRAVAQGLGRDTATPAELDVLALGIQDTNVDSARVALAARLPPSDDETAARRVTGQETSTT